MVEGPPAEELDLHRLEQALFERRRPISERKARTLAAAEHALGERLELARAEPERPLSVYPPVSWRGAGDRDRFFRPLRFVPLGARLHVPLSAPQALPAQPSSAALPSPQGRVRPGWGHRLLTGVELLAALALVVVVGRLYQRLRSLEAPALTTPTVAVVAGITAAPAPVDAPLLPGGHAVSGGEEQATSGAQRAQVALAAPPTPGPSTGQRIEIAAIDVDAVIVQGDSDADLMMGVGQHPGSGDPGQPGNMVLSAHNDIYGQIFRDLDKLEPGDQVLVHTEEGAYRYIVNSVEIVAPTRVDVMEPTEHSSLTLITCYPYLLDTHRVVVIADLAE